MLELRVWKDAATQIFLAAGVGFGGVIALSSYTKKGNNCQLDAWLVPLINFLTSILATMAVFAILGFKANVLNEKCITKLVCPWLKLTLAERTAEIVSLSMFLSSVPKEMQRR